MTECAKSQHKSKAPLFADPRGMVDTPVTLLV